MCSTPEASQCRRRVGDRSRAVGAISGCDKEGKSATPKYRFNEASFQPPPPDLAAVTCAWARYSHIRGCLVGGVGATSICDRAPPRSRRRELAPTLAHIAEIKPNFWHGQLVRTACAAARPRAERAARYRSGACGLVVGLPGAVSSHPYQWGVDPFGCAGTVGLTPELSPGAGGTGVAVQRPASDG